MVKQAAEKLLRRAVCGVARYSQLRPTYPVCLGCFVPGAWHPVFLMTFFNNL
jgi:hypothetical protein